MIFMQGVSHDNKKIAIHVDDETIVRATCEGCLPGKSQGAEATKSLDRFEITCFSCRRVFVSPLEKIRSY